MPAEFMECLLHDSAFYKHHTSNLDNYLNLTIFLIVFLLYKRENWRMIGSSDFFQIYLLTPRLLQAFLHTKCFPLRYIFMLWMSTLVSAILGTLSGSNHWSYHLCHYSNLCFPWWKRWTFSGFCTLDGSQHLLV